MKPSRIQPRKNFDAERLSELSQSIREHGLQQPVLVSFDAITNSYELIAGERRLRACQLAGLQFVEAIVRTPKSDQDRLTIGIIENLQRDNLNAIETAQAYKRLMDFGIQQSQLSIMLGKSKSAISNTLRLLDLPENIQKAVQFEKLTEGHARALLMVDDPVERDKLFKKSLEQSLSVREVERLAQAISQGMSISEVKTGGEKERPLKSADIVAMEKNLEKSFGTRVEIRTKRDEKSGRIIIHFYSLSDFDNILRSINKR